MLLFVTYLAEGPHERKAVLEVFNTARGRRSEAALKTKGTVQSHRDRPLCFFLFFRDWRGRDSGFGPYFVNTRSQSNWRIWELGLLRSLRKKKYMFMHHWVEQGQMLGNIIALMFLGIDFAYLHIGGKCVSKVNKCLECVLEVLNYIFKQLSLICRTITSRGLHVTLYWKLINSGSNKHKVHIILKCPNHLCKESYVPFYTGKFCCYPSTTFLGSLFIPTPRAPMF